MEQTIESIVTKAELDIYELTGKKYSLFIREKEEVVYGIDKDIIINAVCAATIYTEAELKGKCRSRDLSETRMLLMKLLREKGKLSLKAIGRYLNRDHSTVIHGVKTIKNLQEQSWDLRQTELKVIEILNAQKDLTK